MPRPQMGRVACVGNMAVHNSVIKHVLSDCEVNMFSSGSLLAFDMNEMFEVSS